jgi:hypothetical protein
MIASLLSIMSYELTITKSFDCVLTVTFMEESRFPVSRNYTERRVAIIEKNRSKYSQIGTVRQ